MDTEQPLFDMETTAPFQIWDRVVAHTIWGDEPGRLTGPSQDGWARVQLDRGMVLMISTSRLVHEENVR